MNLLEDTRNYYRKFSIRPLATEMWNEFLSEIKISIESSDLNYFFQWNRIRQAMGGTTDSQFCIELKKHLEKSPDWGRWSKLLVSQTTGNGGRPYIPAGKISHSYYLSRLENFISKKIDTLDYILEFGAGYGTLCHSVHSLGFSGKYTIFDFPELIAIQYFYLKSNNINNITHISDINLVPSNIVENNSLFVSTHAIEEAPRELMKSFFSFIYKMKYFMFACSGGKTEIEDFLKTNNIKYNIEGIPSLPGHSIIVGERND